MGGSVTDHCSESDILLGMYKYIRLFNGSQST